MGKQYNKLIKRVRRKNYLKRKREQLLAKKKLSKSSSAQGVKSKPSTDSTQKAPAKKSAAKKAAAKKAPAKKAAAKKTAAKKAPAKKAPAKKASAKKATEAKDSGS